MLATHQKRFDQASKREIQKTAEAIVDLIGKRILSKLLKILLAKDNTQKIHNT